MANLVREDLEDYCPVSNLAINEQVKELQESGKLVYHFGFGQSPFPLPDVAVKALQNNAWRNSYLPVAGIPHLRRAICDFHQHHDNLQFDPDRVIVAPGSKELIFLLLDVFNGDVILKSPTWTTYKPQSLLTRHKIFVVNSTFEDHWKITAENLEKMIVERTCPSNSKILIFCNPCNPSGISYSAQELEKLCVVLRKHHVVVLSDEIYGRLHYTGQHVSIAKFYPEGTIINSGLSKWASAGGWRMGYMLFPPELDRLYQVVKNAGSHTYSCCPAPIQYASVDILLAEGACTEYITHASRILKAVGDYVCRELSSVGVKVIPASSGYHILPDFQILREPLRLCGVKTCTDMCQKLFQDTSIVLMAGGPAFLRPDKELTTRLCYVDFDGAVALTHSRRLGLDNPLPESFVQDYCTHTYNAIQVLKSWVLNLLNRKAMSVTANGIK